MCVCVCEMRNVRAEASTTPRSALTRASIIKRQLAAAVFALVLALNGNNPVGQRVVCTIRSSSRRIYLINYAPLSEVVVVVVVIYFAIISDQICTQLKKKTTKQKTLTTPTRFVRDFDRSVCVLFTFIYFFFCISFVF